MIAQRPICADLESYNFKAVWGKTLFVCRRKHVGLFLQDTACGHERNERYKLTHTNRKGVNP
jgi:hypothetical protein